MAKTFYKLTPKGKKIAKKLSKIKELIEESEDEFERDNVNTENIKEQLAKSDLLYIYEECLDGEFCDMDTDIQKRQVKCYQLWQDGLIKETWTKD
jgi:hypothetical protein